MLVSLFLTSDKYYISVLVYYAVNSAVLCKAGVARQREAEHRDGYLRYGGYSDV